MARPAATARRPGGATGRTVVLGVPAGTAAAVQRGAGADDLNGAGMSEGEGPADGAGPGAEVPLEGPERRAAAGDGHVAPERSGSRLAPEATPAGADGPFEWVRRGLDLLDRGDAWAAAVLLERAAAKEPASSSVREALSRAYFDSGRFAQAAASFHDLVVLNPTSDYAHFGLGLALTRLDRFELAIEHLAMAVAMRPDRREYVDRLQQARATLAARRRARQDLSS